MFWIPSARGPDPISDLAARIRRENLAHAFRLTIAIIVFLVLSGTSCIYAERSKSTTQTSNPITRKLFINPSSTSVRLGKATLIVSPLNHRGGNYVGDYQLKVRPYSFKSETGTLVLMGLNSSGAFLFSRLFWLQRANSKLGQTLPGAPQRV